MVKHDEYENLIWKYTSLPAKKKMKKKQNPSSPQSLFDVHNQIMHNKFASESNPELINKSGQSIVAFLNRGAHVRDMRKPIQAFRIGKNNLRADRPRSKISSDQVSTFKAKLSTYQVKDLYLDYAKYMEPSKIFHLHMLGKDYPTLESDAHSDDHLELVMGKTFMFDRIAMAKEYAHRVAYVDYDIDDDDEDDESMDDDATVPPNKYFTWRDADIDVDLGTHNMELARIIPDPTEIFNGPYYQIPCAWDKLVSNTNI